MPSLDQRLKQGVTHHQAGRLAQAEEIYRQVLSQRSDHAAALNLLGALRGQLGSLDEAEDLFRRAIRVKPDFVESYTNLGFILQRKGQIEDAIAAHRESVRLRPGYVKAHTNLADVLFASGHPTEAINSFRKAIELQSDLAEAHQGLGIALASTGELDEAIASYRRAIQIKPDFANAYNNLGIALRAKGLISESIDSYRQAIRQWPDFAEAHNNLGNAFQDAGRIDEAIAAYREAIRFNSAYADAYTNLGEALKHAGKLDEAIAAHRQAVKPKPSCPKTHSNLVFALHYHPDSDARSLLQELRRWNQIHAEPLKKFIQPHPNNRDPDRRLCIGYVSPDFRDHVVGQNLLPLFTAHDHQQTEIICYSDVVRPDSATDELHRRADTWRDTVGLSNSDLADLIRKDAIDILIDLASHTANNRLPVFARKPAPVQATYLSFCSTTGLDAMDYRLSDPYLDPPNSDLSVYTERTIRLPDTYWCYAGPGVDLEPSAPLAATNGFITFGCLNNFAKVPPALDLWSQILCAVPQSRLIIHSHPGKHLGSARETFSGKGISPDRIEFIGKQLRPDYLATYNRIDIALDPFPWGGGITTCDALWMGVPVITLVGRTPVGRGGFSILSNIGLSELIAKTQEQYLQIATTLAKNLSGLIGYRKSLRQRMRSSPLMNAPRFAKNVEAAYRQMWKTWCAGDADSAVQSFVQ